MESDHGRAGYFQACRKSYKARKTEKIRSSEAHPRARRRQGWQGITPSSRRLVGTIYTLYVMQLPKPTRREQSLKVKNKGQGPGVDKLPRSSRSDEEWDAAGRRVRREADTRLD